MFIIIVITMYGGKHGFINTYITVKTTEPQIWLEITWLKHKASVRYLRVTGVLGGSVWRMCRSRIRADTSSVESIWTKKLADKKTENRELFPTSCGADYVVRKLQLFSFCFENYAVTSIFYLLLFLFSTKRVVRRQFLFSYFVHSICSVDQLQAVCCNDRRRRPALF